MVNGADGIVHTNVLVDHRAGSISNDNDAVKRRRPAVASPCFGIRLQEIPLPDAAWLVQESRRACADAPAY